jgi:glycosyltransferase involved in cell wall biosynthesis
MTLKPVAVCIIVENLPVPFDRRVWQEALALSEAGYRVSVICPKGRGFDASRETREGIEIYRHRLWEASGLLGYFFEYAWALAAEFVLALRVYARTRFRVLQACNPPDTIFLIALFFKLFGVRFIFDHHDLNPELYEAKFGRRGLEYKLVCLAERLTFRTADVAIATNESYRDIALTRGGMRRERTFVVRSYPDLNRLQRVTAEPALKEGRPYLAVYLGVMGPQDGIDLLLESIAVMTKQWGREDVLFALIGSGTELPRLKMLSSSQGLHRVVKFTGRLSDEEVAAYLSTADVGVAPDPATAMNDKSTMNKVLEYIAYGLPVVLYNLTEGRRSAADAALYAERDNPEDFARQIVKLLDSETLRRDLGARGRRRIEESLSWTSEKRALLEAYSTALGSR